MDKHMFGAQCFVNTISSLKITTTSRINVRPLCVLCEAVRFLSFQRVGRG